jgi:hypothetical protein
MRDTRKLVRLFKFIVEYEKLLKLSSTTLTTKSHIQMIGSVGMSGYWFFDNLIFASKAGLCKMNDNWSKVSKNRKKNTNNSHIQ